MSQLFSYKGILPILFMKMVCVSKDVHFTYYSYNLMHASPKRLSLIHHFSFSFTITLILYVLTHLLIVVIV